MSLPVPPLLSPLLDRPVAVLGAGLSGQAAAALLRELGAQAVVYDESAGRGELFRAAQASAHRLAVVSPGFAPEHPWVQAAVAGGVRCLAELDFAALCWSGPSWAVTGTNGKSTLTELLALALRTHGVPARAAGNIGYPLSQLIVDRLPSDTVAVCEVSSFQAETLAHFSPEAAIWTNFAEDHLERHPGMRAYFEAKWRLVERTRGGRVWFGSSVPAFAREYGKELPAGSRVVASDARVDEPALAETVFARPPQSENWLLARALWAGQGLPEAALLQAARRFPQGRHRIERCGEAGGVGFWNDSKGTNFHAVLGALATFGAPPLWIGGGKNKGGDLGGFATQLAGRVRRAYLIGETGAALAGQLQERGVPCRRCHSLEEAVQAAQGDAAPGDQVLLSPGFSSFDMFRNYEDRGERFEAAVRALTTPSRSSPTAP